MSIERDGQRGFTVTEMLLAVALAIAIGLAGLTSIRALVWVLEARATGEGGTVALEQQLDGMRNEAATAFAVFVPLRDVFGNANVAAGVTAGAPASAYVGHELDFYGKTDAGAEIYWTYYFDVVQHTLQRYDYDVAGRRGVADRDTGAIDTNARYPALRGVSAFSARRFEASELGASDNRYAPLLASLETAIGTPAADPVGFLPASGTPRSDLYGGNTTIQVTIATAHGSRTIHLATATLPSGFTIHARPAIRAVVYRINTVHRSWLGFVQKTHAQIFEQLQYSYHPDTDSPNQWKVWCDYELFGANISGLTLSDPNVEYHPENYLESTANVYYTVTHGGFANLNPSPQCSERIPGPSQTAIPVPAASGASPETVDTAPPCFAAGECWPANAPPNWTPPSPWPQQTPPAAWCTGHALSPLCGGPGGSPVPVTGSPPPPVYDENASHQAAAPLASPSDSAFPSATSNTSNTER